MQSNLEELTNEYLDLVLPKQFSIEREKVLLDWVNKPRVARGIVSDFTKRIGDLNNKKVLDIGFGNGITLKTFAESGANMSGLEVSDNLYKFAEKYLQENNTTAELKKYNGHDFPFEDETFDYIYSVSVFEHTDDPEQVLKEAARVLKTGGSFYLAFPNRYNPKETHSGIWFAGWLPRPLSDKLMKLFKRSGIYTYWNLHFLSYFQLRKWIKKNNLLIKIRFETDSPNTLKRIFKKTLAKLGIHHSVFLAHVMVVLDKVE